MKKNYYLSSINSVSQFEGKLCKKRLLNVFFSTRKKYTRNKKINEDTHLLADLTY